MKTETKLNIRSLHERMGNVNHQPVKVHSYTNKRFTVNFRVPLEQLRRIIPEAIELDESDFWVSRLGWIPIPPIRNNDMLFRVSAKIKKGGKTYRAYYTLRSDSSSQLLGFLGKRFSHFRKEVSPFKRIDNEEIYSLENNANDSLCQGKFKATINH